MIVGILVLALAGLLLSPSIRRHLRWRAMEQELEEHRRDWRLGL